MNFKDLSCRWIWQDQSAEPNQYVSFRQFLNLSSKNAKLYISCDTNYVAYLNGKLVGFGQYLASPSNKYYDILELNEYVELGENKLIIDVYYQGVGSSCYAPGKPGLIYAVKCDDTFIPNNDVFCRKISGYHDGDIFNITNQLGTSFCYDASEISRFWNEVCELEFCDVLPISARKRPVKKLITHTRTPFNPISTGEFMINTDSDNPAERIYTAYSFPHNFQQKKKLIKDKLTITKDNTYVIFDLGGETAGYFTIDLNASEGVRIDVGFGEHLIDGRVRTKIDNRNFAFTYYCRNDRNVYTNYFRRIGAKYLQLNFSGLKSPVEIAYAGLIKAEYPVKERIKPTLTDCLDSKIYDASVKTLKCCIHEHYEDTPWREQSLYAMDSRNQTLFGYSAFEDNSAITKSSIDLIATSPQEDGYFSLTAPSQGKKAIPAFTMAWLIWIAEYVKYTKDRNFLLRHERRIKNLIYGFEKKLVNFILPLPDGERIWNFYDWAPGLSDINNKESDVMLNLFFSLALHRLISIEKYFKNKDLILTIRKLYKKVKIAINKNFYDKNDRIYYTFPNDKTHKCKFAQALAICSDVAKGKKKLANIIINDESLTDVTLYSKEFVYEALSHNLKKYGDYILNDIRNIWGKMLFEGADTFYETINGAADFDNAGSLCHGWSAAPAYWYRVLFGKDYFKFK